MSTTRVSFDPVRELPRIGLSMLRDGKLRCVTCGRASNCCCPDCLTCDLMGRPRKISLSDAIRHILQGADQS